MNPPRIPIITCVDSRGYLVLPWVEKDVVACEACNYPRYIEDSCWLCWRLQDRRNKTNVLNEDSIC